MYSIRRAELNLKEEQYKSVQIAEQFRTAESAQSIIGSDQLNRRADNCVKQNT
ncbi:hypothetical protein F511_04470 [Dorcoceras hygrometricum]|uniref:Uncharacterized protein n=1 Tax=Dorcoceras hygrometricum TaxID=472368 RepID=A0A2Z7CFG0_9LAMI|nr:hypothetical protein F511_04470 [Dorcoceras hygrometricum]